MIKLNPGHSIKSYHISYYCREKGPVLFHQSKLQFPCCSFCLPLKKHLCVASGSRNQSHNNRMMPTTSPQATLSCTQGIFSLRCPTVWLILSKARLAFACVLSSVLLQAENSIVAWTKLLMLPKCVLPTSKRGVDVSIHLLCVMCNLYTSQRNITLSMI